jgi:hypothetical protein
MWLHSPPPPALSLSSVGKGGMVAVGILVLLLAVSPMVVRLPHIAKRWVGRRTDSSISSQMDSSAITGSDKAALEPTQHAIFEQQTSMSPDVETPTVAARSARYMPEDPNELTPRRGARAAQRNWLMDRLDDVDSLLSPSPTPQVRVVADAAENSQPLGTHQGTSTSLAEVLSPAQIQMPTSASSGALGEVAPAASPGNPETTASVAVATLEATQDVEDLVAPPVAETPARVTVDPLTIPRAAAPTPAPPSSARWYRQNITPRVPVTPIEQTPRDKVLELYSDPTSANAAAIISRMQNEWVAATPPVQQTPRDAVVAAISKFQDDLLLSSRTWVQKWQAPFQPSPIEPSPDMSAALRSQSSYREIQPSLDTSAVLNPQVSPSPWAAVRTAIEQEAARKATAASAAANERAAQEKADAEARFILSSMKAATNEAANAQETQSQRDWPLTLAITGRGRPSGSGRGRGRGRGRWRERQQASGIEASPENGKTAVTAQTTTHESTMPRWDGATDPDVTA